MAVSAPAQRNVRPIPEGYGTITPSLVTHDAAAAIEFYTRAFGASELSRMADPNGGKIWHAELQVGDCRIMLSDEFPEMDPTSRSPKTLGGTAVNLHVYVRDTDAAFQRAVDAGATVVMPPMDMFWGDRYGKLTDPFGHSWSIATHQEDLSEEEMFRKMHEQPAGCMQS